MLDFCIRGLFSTVKFIEAIRRNISGTQTRPRVARVAPDASRASRKSQIKDEPRQS